MRIPETDAPRSTAGRWSRRIALAGPVLAWGTWLVMTIAAIVFIDRYSMNVPYMDDFALVGVMTGHEATAKGVGGEVVAYVW